ncbi:MAG: methyltransferase domain-containing protein [Thermodesulfobacteriota bacterium]
MDPIISKHCEVWQKKPALRLLYREDIFQRIQEHLVPGPALEIGAGPGFLKQTLTGLISSDITPLKHLDLVCDSQRLPFADASLANVVGVDVIHHFASPGLFFQEGVRVLRPEGRLIFIEPWISPVSRWVYTFLHHEDCREVADPLFNPFGGAKDPWQGNAMIPYQIFKKGQARRFLAHYPDLALMAVTPFSTLAYPLTGGFQGVGLRSERLIKLILRLERALAPWLTRLAAFRVLLVMAKINLAP